MRTFAVVSGGSLAATGRRIEKRTCSGMGSAISRQTCGAILGATIDPTSGGICGGFQAGTSGRTCPAILNLSCESSAGTLSKLGNRGSLSEREDARYSPRFPALPRAGLGLALVLGD